MVILPQQNDHFERESAPRPHPGLPPLGRPAQSDHEALKRVSFYGKELAFYFNRTATLSANGPRDITLVVPPWEAKLR